jgi:predicted nucleic acid-binding protein
MRLFLDSSVLLAACGSANGAASEVLRLAAACGWTLLCSPYVESEVFNNIAEFRGAAGSRWDMIRPTLAMVDDVFTLDQAVVFDTAKDRPILFSALAWADVLLTHDRGDFGSRLGQTFYGLAILTPGMFLTRERAAGRLPE